LKFIYCISICLLVVACRQEDDLDASQVDITATSENEADKSKSTTSINGSSLKEDAEDLETKPLPITSTEVADEIIQMESNVRSIKDPEQLEVYGERQQRLYRMLAKEPDLFDQVSDIVAQEKPEYSLALENNVFARKELFSLTNSELVGNTVPAWNLVEPVSADTLIGYYKGAEEAYGVAWEHLAAINLVETKMGRIDGESWAGAQGPMQFMPATWNDCCKNMGDPTVPKDAINAAAKYLIDRGYKSKSPEVAIRGYNNSAKYVNAVTAYAEVIEDNPNTYYGYHTWGIYYLTSAGIVSLPVGYSEDEPVDIDEWLVDNPDSLVDY